ncbi:MAG: hypothetical protein GXO98_00805 [Nitrospirae bacterium]|nr:hypothetical protein [Nitrospirota bacterium]
MGRQLPRLLLFIFLAYTVVLTVGCGKKENIDTAKKLATALKREGVNYEKIERVDTQKMKYAKMDEAIALKGNNLWVVIFRIEDKKTYEISERAVALLGRVKGSTKKRIPNLPNNIYYKKPFIILVREEPEQGEIRQALGRIFP